MFRKITEGIMAVGVADTDLDKFENQYPLTSGITYNSYIVRDGDAVAVIDSVDRRRGDEWFSNLEAALGGASVGWLVIQHMEPDHSAMIGEFLSRYPGAVVVSSAVGLKMLRQFFPEADFEGRTITVGDNSTLTVGSRELRIATAPMVHWPEVFVTYDSRDKVLFTADAFGTFGTEESPREVWPDEARRYYANIVGKYGAQTDRLLKKTASLGPVEKIAPLHGPVLSGEDIDEAMRLYSLWSQYRPEDPALVAVTYASIYGNTASAALYLAGRIEQAGRPVVTVDLCRQDASFGVAEAFRAGTVVFASATCDGGIFPPMRDFIHHLLDKGLRDRRVAFVENGSWAPAAARLMTSMVSGMKNMTTVGETVTITSAMDGSTRSRLDSLAEAIAAEPEAVQ
ncbi:MAG: FprA family A-type flavoprotein [Clostridium sp.]|nr:FprA family A-type flavoprotein [Clostridium sp.]